MPFRYFELFICLEVLFSITSKANFCKKSIVYSKFIDRKRHKPLTDRFIMFTSKSLLWDWKISVQKFLAMKDVSVILLDGKLIEL